MIECLGVWAHQELQDFGAVAPRDCAHDMGFGRDCVSLIQDRPTGSGV